MGAIAKELCPKLMTLRLKCQTWQAYLWSSVDLDIQCRSHLGQKGPRFHQNMHFKDQQKAHLLLRNSM